MHRSIVLALAATCAACGGSSSPSQPTPFAPRTSPSAIAVRGTIADTLTGATVGSFSATTLSFPLQVRVEAEGYIAREAYVTSAEPTVDLIPDRAPFDLAYYRNLVRNGHEKPEGVETAVLRRWSTSPSVYVRTVDTAGRRVDGANLDVVYAALSSGIVEEVSGGMLSLASYEAGTETREGVRGWITIKWGQTDENKCGTAQIGVSGGWIELYAGPGCTCTTGIGVEQGTVRHEMTHALGFYHTGDKEDLMSGFKWNCTRRNGPLTVKERTHMGIAFKRPPGNRDIDTDPRPSTSLLTTQPPGPAVIVVD